MDNRFKNIGIDIEDDEPIGAINRHQETEEPEKVEEKK